MTRSKGKIDILKSGLLRPLLACSVSLACTVLLSNPVFSQSIITDGNTATNLSTNGNITNITTSTIQNNNAFNSFSKFNVDSGKTVNLIVPNGTDNLINTVYGPASQINGVLKSLRDGKIGGNIFLLNPNGIVVGAAGRINTANLTAITPTSSFMNTFFDAAGSPNPTAVNSVLFNNVPINTTASVINNGKINTIGGVVMSTGTVNSPGIINTGIMFNGSSVEDLVNLDYFISSELAPGSVIVKADKFSLGTNGRINITGGMPTSGSGGITTISRATSGDLEIVKTKNPCSQALQLTVPELNRISGETYLGNFNWTNQLTNNVTSFVDIDVPNYTTLIANGDIRLRNITGLFPITSKNGSVTTGNIRVPNGFISIDALNEITTGHLNADTSLMLNTQGRIRTGNVTGTQVFINNNADVTIGNLLARFNASIIGGGKIRIGNIIQEIGEGELVVASRGGLTIGNINAAARATLSGTTVRTGNVTAGRIEFLNTNILRTGNLRAGSVLLIASESIKTKDINSGGDIDLRASEATVNFGNLKANGNIDLNARVLCTKNIETGGNLRAGILDDTVARAKSISTLKIKAANNVTLAADKIKTADIRAGGTVNLDGNVIKTEDITSNSNINVTADSSICTDNLKAKEDVTLTTKTLNTRNIKAGDDITLTAQTIHTGVLDAGGTIIKNRK